MENHYNPPIDAEAQAAGLRTRKIIELCELAKRINAELRDWTQRFLQHARDIVKEKAEKGAALIWEQVARTVLNCTPLCRALVLGWEENRLQQLAKENENTLLEASVRVREIWEQWGVLFSRVMAIAEEQLALEDIETLSVEIEVFSVFLREPLGTVGGSS